MGTRKQQVIRFRPRGVSDTLDGDNSSPGACASLQNLIQDPTTPYIFTCRPANTPIFDFNAPAIWGKFVWGEADWGSAEGSSLGVITAGFQVGNIIYGLIGTLLGSFAGKDVPFAFDMTTQAFLPVSGITVADCPVSQATSGAWVPPQMTLTGIDLVVTHIGFDGVTNYFGWFDVTNPLLPVWHAGNTTANGLPSVPQGAGTFNNRTYFACGNLMFYTDTLDLNMTNSNQSLSVGDYTHITCVAPLPVGTTSEGIIQGLILFKLTTTYLLIGDEIANVSGVGQPLALNQLSSSVGTGAPRSAVSTPEGVRFMASDGMRVINFFGVMSNPDPDLAVPFINAVTPSRVAAAFNSNTYRICIQNGASIGSPFQDYWLNLLRRSWTGPHTFQYDLAIPLGNQFVLASNILPGKLWNSFAIQNYAGLGNTFVENGVQLSWIYETCPMTDLDNIYANNADRMTVELALPSEGQTYNFIAQNEDGNLLATANITAPTGATIWGSFVWGAANWGSGASGLKGITAPWDQTVVFDKLTVKGSGFSALDFKIGSLQIGYKRLNYLLN